MFVGIDGPGLLVIAVMKATMVRQSFHVVGRGTHHGIPNLISQLGPTCTKCPACDHGICFDGLRGNGTCGCEDRWTGDLCKLYNGKLAQFTSKFHVIMWYTL